MRYRLWIIYAKENLDQQTLGGLIDLIADTAIGDAAAKSKDLLGRVYEYFLGEFANAEGKKGFSKAASLKDIEKHNFILTPGRYVGIPDDEDDGIPYEEKIASLTSKLTEQIQKEAVLNQEIQFQLKKVGIKLEF